MPIRLGILGGGQLGRMITQAAQNLDIQVTVIDPTENCPASQVGATQILGKFTDEDKIRELAAVSDVLTVEIEHVNAEALAKVAAETGIPVHPTPATIALVQDKYLQKKKMSESGVPVGAFRSVSSAADIAELGKEFGYPMMLKSRRLAYDGRGNAVVRSESEIEAGIEFLGSKGELYVEKWVPFERELAVLVARTREGVCYAYDAVETIQKDSICHVVVCPAQIPGDILARAQAVAASAVSHLEGAGIFGIELFQLPSGDVILNEIAPRVHNSGHHTIEAAETSQFEQHARCVTGLPVGGCGLRVPSAVMVNVLGLGNDANAERDTWDICARALAVEGASVHWYGKKGCAKGRKVGHITITGDADMRKTIDKAYSIVNPTATAERPKWATTLAPVVGIIMGSDSDLPTMRAAAEILEKFSIPFELTIVSAHRTPQRLVDYATSARRRGLRCIIAAAGGAAHLPGMVASMTALPVIGVPVPLKHLDGVDSLYSIVQMPRGIPVATVAIGNSTNAALLAVRIVGAFAKDIGDKVEAYAKSLENEVLEKVHKLDKVGWKDY